MRAAVLVLLAAPAFAETVTVPSGQPVSLQEELHETSDAGPVLRLRYVAPEVALHGFQVASQDMAHLCADVVTQFEGPRPAEIIISFASEEIAFGTSDPEVTQFFEVYSLDGPKCVVEPF